MIGVRFPASNVRKVIFSFHRRLQTGSATRPVSYPTDIGAFFRGDKAAVA